MSKPNSNIFKGTAGDKIEVIRSLPLNHKLLVSSRGWKEVSHPKEVLAGHHKYIDPKSGLVVRFDERVEGAPGFRGKDHYHVYNPNSTSCRDYYLDKDGRPVPKRSKESHILPK